MERFHTTSSQSGLKIEPVDLGHTQVGDDAARLVAPALVKKGGGN
jgi:hypothetical protein